MRVWHGVGLLIALKAILLAIDPTIRLYLGDSAAYLYGARDDGRLPDDRSFTYSFLIRALVRPFEQLTVLAFWQTLAGVVIALTLWLLLTRRFGVSRTLAFVAACVLVLEPAQLYYERMVLAETFGLFMFVMFFAASGAHLATRGVWWLPIAATLGLLAATLRLNFLPIVLVLSLLLPWLPLLDRRRPSLKTTFAHGVVALVAVAVLHGSYCYWVGQIFSVPPSYLGRAGFMQLGLVMPLVKPEHLARVGLADFDKQLHYSMADPDARMRHLWSAGGFFPELRRRRAEVEPIARQLAGLAIADDPLGIVRLGLHTFGGYFREADRQSAIDNDLGRFELSYDMLWNLREHWKYEAEGLHTRVTAVSWWFETGTWWLVACLVLLAPISVLNMIVHWQTERRLWALLAGLVGVGLVATHMLFVPVAFYRYMHPLPFFVLLNVVPVGLALRPAFRRQSPACPP